MTDYDVVPDSEPTGEDVATLRAKVDDLEQRNAALEGASSSRHRAGATARASAVVVLVVLGTLLTIAAVPSIWARNLVLNTDRYVETLQPLASNAGLQNAVIKAVDAQFDQNVDIAGVVKDTLPPRAAATLAGPLQAGAASLVNTVVTKFVKSDVFRNLWSTINRAAHQSLVAVLTGHHKDRAALSVKNGVLYLNLAPVITTVKQRLVNAGLGIAANVPAVGASVELLQVKGVTKAQSLVRALDDAADWLPILALACFAGAIATSTRRRRTTIASSFAVAGGMVIIALGLVFARRIYLDNLPLKYLSADEAGDIFDTMVRYLRDGLRIVFVVALLVCVIAWLTSSSSRAQTMRSHFRDAVGAVSARRSDSRAVRVIAANRTAVVAVLVALGSLVLVLWTNPGIPAVIVIVAVTGALVGIVQSLSPSTHGTTAHG